LTAPPNFIAVNGSYIYWGSGRNAIGRANLDGTGVNESFITGTGGAVGVAVDGNYIYWTDFDNHSVARANLDGTGVNTSFITGASTPEGIAVDGSHIYWANHTSDTIGRANLDGSGVNESFISHSPGSPIGVAVNGAHIYYSDTIDLVWRSNLDGSGLVPLGIATTSAQGIAVDSNFIYWTNQPITISAGTTIGRANLDGSGPNESFITLDPGSGPVGVAVAPTPESSTSLLMIGGLLGLTLVRRRLALSA